jgi:hypothetical protein
MPLANESLLITIGTAMDAFVREQNLLPLLLSNGLSIEKKFAFKSIKT